MHCQLQDVIDHVTIGLGVGTFILVVNDDRESILHGYGNTGLQSFGLTFWGHVTSTVKTYVTVVCQHISVCNLHLKTLDGTKMKIR